MESKILIASKQLEIIWEKLFFYLQKYDEENYIEYYRYDYYDDNYIYEYQKEIYNGLDDMEKFIANNETIWEVRKKILEELVTFSVNNFFESIQNLNEIAESLCILDKEKCYLADFLIENFQNEEVDWAINLYFEANENEKFLKLREKKLKFTYDYFQLSQYYDRIKDYKSAVEILEKAIKNKTEGRVIDIFEYLFKYYSEKNETEKIEQIYSEIMEREEVYYEFFKINLIMYEYYKKNNNYEKKKRFLLQLFKSCRRDEKMWYEECKKEIIFEEFEKIDNELLELLKNKNLNVYLDVCIEKGNKYEVLQYILGKKKEKNYFSDINCYFSKQLMDDYPKEIMKYYCKEAEEYAKRTNKKAYVYSVDYLKLILEIVNKNKFDDEWKQFYNIFLGNHKRKSNLMKEIKARLKI